MNTFKPGDKVTVHVDGHPDITGVFEDRGAVHTRFRVGDKHFFAPNECVERVTPPCPWTDEWTIVRFEKQPNDPWLAMLDDHEWYRLGGVELIRLDWAADIAPFNPVRLVPEGSEKAAIVAALRGMEETNYVGYSINEVGDLIERGDLS